MRYLYSALLYALLPLVVLRMLWRSQRAPAYRQRLAERFGVFAAPPCPPHNPSAPAIWVHAVSVGEVLAAAPLVERLLLDYPEYRVVVTTTTPTGSERVLKLFGKRVFHVYAPWDLPGSVRRFLRRTGPRLLVLMETELWPNLLHYSRADGCRTVLANARLSSRSARNYARFASLTRSVLAGVDRAACQSAADGERLVALGLPPHAVAITGSIKFDLQPDAAARAAAEALCRQLGADTRPVLLAASTHEGEEEHLLDAFRQLRQRMDDCLLVLAPRHPERCVAVHALCAAEGWQVARRSATATLAAGDDILLVDSVGELALLYAGATVAFIGGSLVAHGGHNMLEAAVWGVPVVSGPHLENFAAISALLLAAGAMIVLQQPPQLAATLGQLFSDPALRRAMGAAGQQVMAENRGAQQRLLELVEQQLGGG